MLASKEKISIRQAFILFIMVVYSPSIRLFPISCAKIGKQAGWLSPIFAIVPLIILIYILQAMFVKNREENLSDIFFKVLGNFLGRIVLTLYLLWIVILIGLFVRYFAERFLTSLLPDTPMNFFTITLLTVVFFAVRGGIVQLTRTIEFIFSVFSIVFVLIFILSIANVKVYNLFPITYYDILPVAKSTYSTLGIWVYVTYIFFFADKINDKEHIKRFGLQSTIYLLITGVMILIQTIGVYGYTIVERVSMPYFLSVKSISLLKTIERVESIALTFWVMVDFSIISILMYIVVSILKSLFSLSGTKSFVSPITLFALIFSHYIAINRFELESFSSIIALPVNIFFGIVVPVIVFVIGKIRRKI